MTTELEIEDGIEIPPRRTKADYGFDRLAVGQSLLIPVSDAYLVFSAASYWKIRHPGWDYTTRPQPDGSRRLWRIA